MHRTSVIGRRLTAALEQLFYRWFLLMPFWPARDRAREAARSVHLRRSLAACGARLSVQPPVTITNPEQVTLGDDVSLAAYVHVWGGGGVSIGHRVMIGTHTSISSLTHDYRQHPMHQSRIRRPVRLEDDVWIGSNACILPGITIGRGAVVGAGAVVTRDVPPFAVVAGVPARVVATRELGRETPALETAL